MSALSVSDFLKQAFKSVNYVPMNNRTHRSAEICIHTHALK